MSTGEQSVPGVDHIFVGEAETTVPEFVADLAAGSTKRVYQAAERPQLSLTPARTCSRRSAPTR